MKTPVYIEDIQEQLDALTERARGMGYPDAFAAAHIYGAALGTKCQVIVYAIGRASGTFDGPTFAACFFAAHRALDERDPALLAKTLGVET